MASRIITKKGSGAPLASDLVHGELAVDTVNKRLYTENAGGTIIELGTAPSTIDINAGTIDGTVIGGSSAAAGTFTTITASGEITANGGIAFGDNDKATFGASDDLQIYHDGSNSYISDTGTGNLTLLGGNFRLRDTTNTTDSILANPANYVKLYYAGDEKLSTVSAGINVTGTVTADGLTVDGTDSGGSGVFVTSSTGGVGVTLDTKDFTLATAEAETNAGFLDSDNSLIVRVDSNDNGTGDFFITEGSTDKVYFKAANNGDISFYEDTGTTAKFFWDASAESLGIGTASPVSYDSVARNLVLAGTSDAGMTIASGTASAGNLVFADGTTGVDAYRGILKYDHASDAMSFFTNGVRNMTIDSSGNVGIGTSSPVAIGGYSSLTMNNTTGTFVEFQEAGTNRLRIGGDNGSAFINGSSGILRLLTSDAERMRIDSSGSLLVGKTSANYTTAGFEVGGSGAAAITRSSDQPLALNRLTNDGAIVGFYKDGTAVGSIGNASSALYVAGGSSGVYLGTTGVAPTTGTGALVDNTRVLGTASYRWSTVYAATALINTSDEREKTPLEDLDAAELAVAKELKAAIKKFKFKDAVEAKGEAARLHVGVGAQTVKAIFESHGLVAEDYAILCYDEWDAEFDEDGNETRPAGNRYGVRYEELLAFIIAAI